MDKQSDLGTQVAHSGVGNYDPRVDYIEVKAYYQWVPFVLFLQGVMFYVPHIIYKWAEEGKIKVGFYSNPLKQSLLFSHLQLIIAGLNQWVMDNEERSSKEAELATYLVETRGTHTSKMKSLQCIAVVVPTFSFQPGVSRFLLPSASIWSMSLETFSSLTASWAGNSTPMESRLPVF